MEKSHRTKKTEFSNLPELSPKERDKIIIKVVEESNKKQRELVKEYERLYGTKSHS